MTTTKMSTNKIFVLLVFLCAAIMTSLFVFRLSHKAAPVAMSKDSGILFPTPRDINKFSLVSADEQKFSQQNLLGHWTLLFFGFTHCSSICPTTLDMLQRAYNKLHTSYPTLQVVLISLDPERDTPTALAKYTHAFNPDFIGVSGKIQDLRKLQSQFGIYSERDTNTDQTNYQIQHTGSILLINPQGKWVGLFNANLNPTQFIQAFTNGVNSTHA